jgi:hypothetical protein
MFLESVNKNKPGKLCFKVIQKIWCFLTNPNVGPMIVLRASVQNIVMGIQQWNTVANSRSEINKFCCYNVIRNREPIKFNDQVAYRTHVVECYGHNKGIGGRRM